MNKNYFFIKEKYALVMKSFFFSISVYIHESMFDLKLLQTGVKGWVKLMQVNSHVWYQSNFDQSHQLLFPLVIVVCRGT